MDGPLASAWTRRHARTRLAVAAWCLLVGIVQAAVVLAAAQLASAWLLAFSFAVLVVDAWLCRRCVRLALAMRRIHVDPTPEGLAVEGIAARRRLPWEDVERFVVDRSSERLGRATQLSVYAQLAGGERVELEALRVDGLLASRARKEAALAPYRDALASRLGGGHRRRGPRTVP